MKTIFITSFHPLISRNVLSAPIISGLVKGGDVRVVVFIPGYKKKYFEDTYARPGVIFEGVETGAAVRSWRVGLLKRLAEALPNTRRARLGRARNLSGEKKALLYYYLFYLPAGLLGRFFLFVKLFRFIDFWISPRGRFYPLIERYRPDLIFATDVQNEHDVALMQDARKKEIKIAAMVRSWDNLTTRAIRFVPHLLLVHNEVVRDEAVRIHGINPERIAVVGIPYYDKYLRGPGLSRGEFFKTWGLEPNKKLIVYIPVCDYRLRENTVDRLALETLAALEAVILVRFPPAETVNLKGFQRPANVIFDRPGYVFDEKKVNDRELTPQDDERFINILAWCDVVVSGPSTVAIDAALFDRPVVLVDFYPRPIPEDEKIYEYDAEHFSRILKSDGVSRAQSQEEFLRQIHEYLRHPEKDRSGRARIVREQCWKTDGQSSQRIASTLLEFL